MSFILAIIIGGAIGYIANDTAPTRQNQFMAIINGVAGGLLGLWFFTDILQIDPIVSFGTVSIMNIFFGIVGSLSFLALIEYAIGTEKSMKEYETTISKQKAVKLEPVFAHQFEEVKIKKKKSTKK